MLTSDTPSQNFNHMTDQQTTKGKTVYPLFPIHVCESGIRATLVLTEYTFYCWTLFVHI